MITPPRSARRSWTLPLSAPGAVGFLLFAAALLVFHWTVVRLDPHSSVQTGFAPWPDGPEAMDMAVNLARNGSFSIHIAGQELPSRYPFGYSLLGALAIVLGASPETALYRVNQVAGLTLLLLVFVHLARRKQILHGGWAALALASTPAFIVLCRGPRSEVASLATLTAGWICLVGAAKDKSRVSDAAGALLFGASLWFRISNILLLPFLGVAVMMAAPKRPVELFRRGCSLAGFALLGVSPLLVYNWLVFGRPLGNGYSFWLTTHTSADAFQLQHIPAQVEYLWKEVIQRESIFRTAHLYGYGSYLNPSAVAALLVGSTLAWRSPRWRWCAAAGGFYGAAMLSYFYTDFRLYFPVFALALVGSVVVLVDFAAREWGKRSIRVFVPVLLLLFAVLGVPGKKGWSALVDLTNLHSVDKTPQSYLLIERARHELPRRALLLTDLNPPYVHGLGEEGWIVAPLTSKHDYRFNPKHFVFDEARRDAMVQARLGETPVAAIATVGFDALVNDCPLPAPFRWKPLYTDERGGVLAVASE